MHKRNFLWASGLPLMSLWTGNTLAAEPLQVTASFSILGDLLAVVGADRVRVTTLVGADEDAHLFAPSAMDAKRLLTAKLLVSNGLGFDPWATKLSRAAGFKGLAVQASQGVQQEGHDPHAWQNPQNVLLYVRNIAQALSQVDPAGASFYQANAAQYTQQLLALDQWAKEQFAAIPIERRTVITSHDAFGYFARHYGLQFLAPVGISTESEPSARQLAQLIRLIQREKIKTLFVESMSNPRLLEQISRETGATMGARLYSDALSKPGEPGSSYLLMVRHNVTQLAAGMQRN